MTSEVTTLPEKDTLLDLYRTMQTIRQWRRNWPAATRGLVHGACHTYVGEEAIARESVRTWTGTMSSSAPTAVTATLGQGGSSQAN
ncbi:MAG: hypothetical protein Ct9H300mP1_33950 [Planctomycetaceae bacterium]|nr:MAG: hypothetical protein Ct9H300mP1_33950 [Planctomycetaceae bacterium]